MHSDLCLSFPVGDILSESTGNLPILQRGTAEEKVPQLYTCRNSQRCWEGKQKIPEFHIKCQEHAHKLPVGSHWVSSSATKTQHQIQKRIYAIIICIDYGLMYKAIKDVRLKGTCSSQGC